MTDQAVTLANQATLGGSHGTGVVPLTVKGASGQTADLFEVKNFAGTNMFAVSAAGAITFAGGVTVSAGGITVAGASTFQSGGVTVQAGGLVVTAGGLTITAGGLGIGTAATAVSVITTGGSVGLHTLNANTTLTATGNGLTLSPLYASGTFAAAGFTTLTGAGVQIDAFTFPAGYTNGYGLLIGTPSGASAENYAIKASGVSFIGGSGGGLIVSSNLGVAPVAPAGTIALGSGTGTTATAGTNGAPPAQVAGYWFINVAGTIGKVPYYLN